MKLCMVSQNYPRYRGDFQPPFIEYISENICKHGIDVTVLIPYDCFIDREEDDHTVEIITYKYIYPKRLHLLGYSRTMVGDVKLKKFVYFLAPFMFLFAFLALFRICIKKHFDLIHAHWVLPNGFIAALVSRILNIPLVINLHGSGFFIAQSNQLFLVMAKFALKTARRIISANPDFKERLASLGIDINKFEVIPNGAEPYLFNHVSSQTIDELQDKLDINKSDLKIFVLGRLAYKKGVNYLIRAMPLILTKHKNVKLIIGGGGELMDEFKRLVHNLNIEKDVRFIGSIPHNQVPVYLSLCDIFVAPSIRDSKGNVDTCPCVILEAMASGKPVVASRIGGIPLVIKSNEGGILVEEKNESELANAISYLLSNQKVREEYGRINQARIRDNLSWENIAKCYIEVYHKSLKPL